MTNFAYIILICLHPRIKEEQFKLKITLNQNNRNIYCNSVCYIAICKFSFARLIYDNSKQEQTLWPAEGAQHLAGMAAQCPARVATGPCSCMELGLGLMRANPSCTCDSFLCVLHSVSSHLSGPFSIIPKSLAVMEKGLSLFRLQVVLRAHVLEWSFASVQ